MKITVEYLRHLCNQMVKQKVAPLPVYIAIIGNKKFMCPISSLPENIAPLPMEIVGSKFPVEVNIKRVGSVKMKTCPKCGYAVWLPKYKNAKYRCLMAETCGWRGRRPLLRAETPSYLNVNWLQL